MRIEPTSSRSVDALRQRSCSHARTRGKHNLEKNKRSRERISKAIQHHRSSQTLAKNRHCGLGQKPQSQSASYVGKAPPIWRGLTTFFYAGFKMSGSSDRETSRTLPSLSFCAVPATTTSLSSILVAVA